MLTTGVGFVREAFSGEIWFELLSLVLEKIVVSPDSIANFGCAYGLGGPRRSRLKGGSNLVVLSDRKLIHWGNSSCRALGSLSRASPNCLSRMFLFIPS